MQLEKIYKALADESRLRTLNILNLGIFNVQELTSLLGLSQPTVSHHLKILASVGLVRSVRDNKQIFYSLNEENSQPIKTITEAALRSCDLVATSASENSFNTDHRNAQRLAEERRKRTTKFFDAHAKDWSELRTKALGQENFIPLVKELFSDRCCILDLGCGNGVLLESILPRHGTTIGIDCSESMLQECKNKLNSKARLVDLRLGYMEHLPVGDETVDCTVAYMSLHHVPNPSDAIKEAWRALKIDGQFIIVDLIKHTQEYMRTDFADLWLGFDQQQLQQWLLTAGFDSIEYKPVGKLNEVFMLTCKKYRKDKNDKSTRL